MTALDLDEVVRRTEGLTPAAIARVVATAALDVFREATATGTRPPLDADHLVAAVERFGGQDRPTVESWSWETVILPAETKRQLKRIQAVIEDPASARRFGIEPPTGLLMAGPPGTGKTTVAKVLAAQARCSFYGVSGADVMSKWVGEAEANIRRLFDRARENRSSIVFIDEIDALAARRGAVEVNDSRINQLLAEIDGVAGQRGVFVIGATNRPDKIDPALLRGGRLSRTFVLGLPDLADRRALLELYTSDMPVNGLDLGELARETDGMAPGGSQGALSGGRPRGHGSVSRRRARSDVRGLRRGPDATARRVLTPRSSTGLPLSDRVTIIAAWARSRRDRRGPATAATKGIDDERVGTVGIGSRTCPALRGARGTGARVRR